MLRSLKAELQELKAQEKLAGDRAGTDAGAGNVRHVRDVDFVLVYVAEAHAQDEWPISSARYNADRGPVCVTQPRSQGERLALAQRFKRQFDPAGDTFDGVLVDDVGNEHGGSASLTVPSRGLRVTADRIPTP